MRHTLLAALLLCTPLLADDVEVKLPKGLLLKDLVRIAATSTGGTVLFSEEDLKGRKIGGPFLFVVPGERLGDVFRFVLSLSDIAVRDLGGFSNLSVLVPKTATVTRFRAVGLDQPVEFNRPPSVWHSRSDAEATLTAESTSNLVTTVNDPEVKSTAKTAAARLLGSCGPRNQLIVDALTTALASKDATFIAAVSKALGRLGYVARSALPALKAVDHATARAAIEEILHAVSPALFNPRLARETAPDSFKVKFETTKGDIVLDVTRAWSPHGADRFYNLVRIGYFHDIAFFRMVPRFVAQFGIHGDPRVNGAWRNARIMDDPVKQTNKTGTVSFANSGPNSRSVQFFINTADNNGVRLDLDKMGFSPFAKVVEGMDVVQRLNAEYGERPKQQRMQFEGNDYLRKFFGRLDYIERATILK